MPEPSKLSAVQAELVVAWFATLPLTELRYRQSLAITQMKFCAMSPNPAVRVDGHQNQFIVWKQLSAAIGRQQCNPIE